MKDSLARSLVETQARLKMPGLTPQEREELERLKKSEEAQIARPQQFFASFLLNNWKLQRHFYARYGGGRVLWQQAGLEAFDAYRKWLESEEQKGSFRITDPKLRTAFYHYWKKSHVPFMIEDEDRIRTEFLQPKWAPRGTRSANPAR